MLIRPKGRKKIVMIAVSAALLLAGFFIFNGYIYREKQAEPGEMSEPYEATLSGEYACLPHRDTTGPQTLECAMGLKTESGEYYALDFGESQSAVNSFLGGEQTELSGTITPIENLSTDHWQKYEVSGILSVKSINSGYSKGAY